MECSGWTPHSSGARECDFLVFSLTGLQNRYFQRVSTTEHRIVLIIRTLINNTAMLIIDEPDQFFEEQLIRRANCPLDYYCLDRTLIFVIHHEEEILPIIDKTTYVNQQRNYR